ncbi:hypothetical protein GALMADRAFT_920811 [Galerina marginata CBS 339.88]|uniref:Uncharacterized protein n=1 Tax=Galerina marginata (strain CBS 339.88) TaxID=685588 RepID=A0A067SEY5_GALM3|nr:hypothetical protein GALMADRAFT_920811 [Galerina marginata CBS 339.88]
MVSQFLFHISFHFRMRSRCATSSIISETLPSFDDRLFPSYHTFRKYFPTISSFLCLIVSFSPRFIKFLFPHFDLYVVLKYWNSCSRSLVEFEYSSHPIIVSTLRLGFYDRNVVWHRSGSLPIVSLSIPSNHHANGVCAPLRFHEAFRTHALSCIFIAVGCNSPALGQRSRWRRCWRRLVVGR